MIDKIFDMIIQEATKRGGKYLSWKLYDVCLELDAKIMEAFEELNPDFYVWLPDDPEELATNKGNLDLDKPRRNHDRSYLRRHTQRSKAKARQGPRP